MQLIDRIVNKGLGAVTSGPPDPDDGRNNDFRYDPASKLLYFKVAGAWEVVSFTLTFHEQGTLAERDAFDDEAAGFTFLDHANGNIYIKKTGASGDWAGPFAFVGPQGIQGIQGEHGRAGIPYSFDESTDTESSAGTGKVWVGALAGSPFPQGEIAIAKTDANGGNRNAQLMQLIESSTVEFRSPDGTAFRAFHVIDTPNGASGDFVRIPVEEVASHGSFSQDDETDVIITKIGVDGADPFYLLTFETGTTPPSLPGKVRADHADLSQATKLYVSKTNRAGSAIGARLLEIGSPDKTLKDRLALTNSIEDTQASFVVESVSDEGDYVEVAVSGHAGETDFPHDTPISVQPQIVGRDGAHPGLAYNFDDSTAEGADPGTVRANHADLAQATELYFANEDRVGNDHAGFLTELGDSTSLTKGRLSLKRIGDGAQALFRIDDATVPETGYVKVPVTYRSGATGFDDGDGLVMEERLRGDAGTGNVSSVNEVEPDGAGDVSLTAADIPGFGNAATLDVGTAAGTVAAGDDSRFHDPVSLAGTPNYITLSGQVITRALVNLTSHITGILPIANGGTDASTAANARANLGANNASNLTTGTVADARLPTTQSGKNFTGNVGFSQSSPQAQIDMGNNTGQKLYVYRSSNTKMGFGANVSGASRELTIHSTTPGTSGRISFGFMSESDGETYTERASLTHAGLFTTTSLVAGTTALGATEWGTFSDSGASVGTLQRSGGLACLRDSSFNGTGTGNHLRLHNPNGQVGSATTSGSGTNWATTSDRDLKDKVEDADPFGAVTKIKAGRAVRGEYKAEPGVEHPFMFIAQEMADVCPDAVVPPVADPETGELSPWMMDYGRVTPLLFAGLKRVTERMEALDSYVGQPEPDDYRARRRRAYYELSPEADVLHSMGDTLDVLIKQVETIRQAVGAPLHPEFEARLEAIEAVKKAHPKPDR